MSLTQNGDGDGHIEYKDGRKSESALVIKGKPHVECMYSAQGPSKGKASKTAMKNPTIIVSDKLLFEHVQAQAHPTYYPSRGCPPPPPPPPPPWSDNLHSSICTLGKINLFILSSQPHPLQLTYFCIAHKMPPEHPEHSSDQCRQTGSREYQWPWQSSEGSHSTWGKRGHTLHSLPGRRSPPYKG